ncbi:hypothetical protein [Bacillus halotolerans]|uniref:hypothetical protein n=1 Tax=Bacillus halotolerans TaxID=260554 RepID=UPI00192C276D|nr:hypothetical protein [Bacillus halotolerans]MBL4978787.1 hypothetical protein [Bacillus halotolerans]
MSEYTECPKCGNDQLIEYGEMTVAFEKSVKTRSLLKRDKRGYDTWWVSETFTE